MFMYRTLVTLGTLPVHAFLEPQSADHLLGACFSWGYLVTGCSQGCVLTGRSEEMKYLLNPFRKLFQTSQAKLEFGMWISEPCA